MGSGLVHVGVLGGGPAGAAAALTLRNAGQAVTIIEREVFPRYRPGETLHPGIEPLLEKLGVAENLLEGGYLRQTGIWSKWEAENRFTPYGADETGPWRGFQAPRADFDQRMLESACQRGAQRLLANVTGIAFDPSGAVNGVETSVGRIAVDWVIDCTGGSHSLARQLKIPVIKHSPTLVARFGYVRGQLELPNPSISADKTGWTWIAEVEPGRYQWTRVTEPKDRPDMVWIPPELCGLMPESCHGADVTWRMVEKVSGCGWFIAGDAAAVLDPSSSHGVLRAVLTGMMAGHLIIQNSLQRATKEHCAEFYQDWLSARFLHDVEEMKRLYGLVDLFGFSATG